MKLFEDEFPEDKSPEDNTQITTTLLYFSETELKEFKSESKQAMKKMFGTECQVKGNLSDMLLNLLKLYNGKDNPAPGA
jgi:hypothetical protein